jgi:hypothetical protein
MPKVVTNIDGHDPWWDLDGREASGRRQRALFTARVAFVVAIGADLAVFLGWAIRLGLGDPSPVGL